MRLNASSPIHVGMAMLWLFAQTAAGQGMNYPPVPVEMPVKRVSQSVYLVQGAAGIATDNAGFVSNAGFVVTGEGVVVFDALGTPPLAHRLVTEIRRITPEPIRHVVLSHFHADHAYGLQVFADLGAEIIASSGVREYLSSEIAGTRLAERRRSLAPWVDASTRLVMPHRFVESDYRFRLGDHDFLVTNHGSAHSEGDVTLYVEPDRVLFSGDILFEARIPFLGSANTRGWLQTLTKLEATDVRAMIPGHGPMSDHPKQTLSLTRRYLQYVRQEMGNAVADWVPFDEAYERVNWEDFMEYPAFLEANRRNAYAVYLSLEAESLR